MRSVAHAIEMDNKVNNSGSGKLDKLLSPVDALTNQANSLKPKLREIKIEKRGDKYHNRNKYLCRDCFSNNKNYCNHCFKCGSSSHMACRKNEKRNANTSAGCLVVDSIKPRAKNCSKILMIKNIAVVRVNQYFCGKNCQIQFWKDHKQVSNPIFILTAQRERRK